VDVITALNNGQIDGYLTDAPTAYVNVLIGQVDNGVVVGQFPAIEEQEYFGLVFEEGNPLRDCVNTALVALREDGTLESLESEWLRDVTFPEFQQ
jgi:polar amino acid transport system substrate-binding protein